jgi:hypothetical protein
MTSVPTVSVLKIDPAGLPPIPDREPIDRWMQRYEEVGSHRVGPPPEGIRAGHYQHVLLDTRTGELAFHCGDWRNPPIHGQCTRAEWKAQYPGRLFVRNGGPHQWFEPVPDLLCWVIDSGVKERPYLNAVQAAHFLDLLIPLAQRLLDHLLPIPGTTDRDYSPEAASAGRDIDRACSRHVESPLGLRPNLVLMDRVVEVMPELVKPRWATADDATLDQEAEMFTRFFAYHHPQLHRLLDVPEPTSSFGRLEILGARAWMHRHRLEMSGTNVHALGAAG